MSEDILDYASALAEVRGNDPRPLIVLRDCDACGGRDDALLSRTMSNEKTVLMTHWFHCVKLDRRVVEKSHPFHALFSEASGGSGARVPHLFLASWDASVRVPLDGKQSQKRLWSSLTKILRAEYRKDPKVAVRQWVKVLNKFDYLDDRRREIERQIPLMEDKRGPKSSKVKRLRAQLAKVEAEMKMTLGSEKEILDLILRRKPKAKSLADFDAEAAAAVRAGSGGSLLERIRKKSEQGDTKRPSPEGR